MALKAGKSGFKYKPRTSDQLKERANRKSSLFDSIFKQGFDTYRPKQGDNLFRYLPPTWDDSDHYGFTAFVHQNIGANNSTYLCLKKMLGKPCPVCEAELEAKNAGESEEAQNLKARERLISWVIDRDGDDPEKPLLYDQSWTQDRDIASLCVNERTGEILMIDHPDTGYDVTIKRQGTGLRTKYYGYAIARDESPIAEKQRTQDEILSYIQENPVPNTLNYYDYDYLQGVLSGSVAEKDKDIEDDEDEDRLKRTKRKPAAQEEDEDETPRGRTARRKAEPEEDEDDEQDEAPRGRRKLADDEDAPFDGGKRARGPRRDNDPADAEDEEDEPAPRNVRGASRKRPDPEEDDEQDEPPAKSSSRRRPEPVDEEEDEEDDRPPARSSKQPARSRVVEDEEEDEEEEQPRRRSTRVR